MSNIGRPKKDDHHKLYLMAEITIESPWLSLTEVARVVFQQSSDEHSEEGAIKRLTRKFKMCSAYYLEMVGASRRRSSPQLYVVPSSGLWRDIAPGLMRVTENLRSNSGLSPKTIQGLQRIQDQLRPAQSALAEFSRRINAHQAGIQAAFRVFDDHAEQIATMKQTLGVSDYFIEHFRVLKMPTFQYLPDEVCF